MSTLTALTSVFRDLSHVPDAIVASQPATDNKVNPDSLPSGHSTATLQRLVARAVTRLQRRWTIKPQDYDDALQEALVAAIEADRAYDPAKGKWRRWVALRAEGAVLDFLYRERQWRRTGGAGTAPELFERGYDRDTADDTGLASGEGCPEALQINDNYEEADADTLYSQLLPGQRDIMYLLRQGYTQDEIATRLGVVREAVKNRITRIRDRLSTAV